MLKTTAGQLLVNEALPRELRDYQRVLDKKGTADLLNTIATRYPERYVEVSKQLADIGRTAATRSGGTSFGLEHLRKSKAGQHYTQQVRADLKKILGDDRLNDQQRHELILRRTGAVQEPMVDAIMAESLQEDNPLARQVLSGSRGNKVNLSSLRGADLLYVNHRNEPLSLPVTHSYSEGLKPVEYWAATYGARKGVFDVKSSTAQAGYFGKLLNQVSHRLMVTDHDGPQVGHKRGLPVETADPDNEGAVLAHDVGNYKADTVLSPKALKDLVKGGHERILVRSPTVGGSPSGGVYARDVGVRERGVLPGRGEQVGLTSAQAIAEPVSQGMLSSKHSGGVAGQAKSVSGFERLEQMVQIPRTFKSGATHSDVDGAVQRIEDAPAGGKYVTVDGQSHYVAEGLPVKVKPGQHVEAGDVLSEGLPNPATIVQHKGIGEGRRYFVQAFSQAMRDGGLKVHRRNVELLSRGLINHVRLTDEHGGHAPDDVLHYSTLEHTYEPRRGHEILRPGAALGQYLEAPVLHYTIGTKVRPSVVKDLEHFGVKEIAAHKDAPPFEPEMIRGMSSLHHDPDWMTRMYGSGLKSSLLEAVHRGRSSDELGTSFVPGLARAVNFGEQGLVHQPEAGTKPEEPAMAKKTPNPVALDIKPSSSAKGSGSWLSGMFKLSTEVTLLREAQDLLQKTAKQVGQIVQTRTSMPIKHVAPTRATRTIKMATEPAPPPQPQPRTPMGPRAQPPFMGPQLPARTPAPAQPRAAAQPTFTPPQAPGPRGPGASTADVYAQLGRQAPQAYMSGSAYRPANYGGYRHDPRQGLFYQHSDPESMRAFVAGNPQGEYDPHDAFGSSVRFFSGLNAPAVGALTSGQHYVPRGDDDFYGDEAAPDYDAELYGTTTAARNRFGGSAWAAQQAQQAQQAQPGTGTAQAPPAEASTPPSPVAVDHLGRPLSSFSNDPLRWTAQNAGSVNAVVGNTALGLGAAGGVTRLLGSGAGRVGLSNVAAALRGPVTVPPAANVGQAMARGNLSAGQALSQGGRLPAGTSRTLTQRVLGPRGLGGRVQGAARVVAPVMVAADAARVLDANLTGQGGALAQQHAENINRDYQSLAHATEEPIEAGLAGLNMMTAHLNPASNVNVIAHGGAGIAHGVQDLHQMGASGQAAWQAGHADNSPLAHQQDYRTFVPGVTPATTPDQAAAATAAAASRPPVPWWNPMGHVEAQANRVIQALPLAGESLGTLAQTAGALNVVQAQGAQQHAAVQARHAALVNNLRDINTRWQQAGSPGGDWRDPQSGHLYTPGERADYQVWERDRNLTQGDMIRRGQNLPERIEHTMADVVHRAPAVANMTTPLTGGQAVMIAQNVLNRPVASPWAVLNSVGGGSSDVVNPVTSRPVRWWNAGGVLPWD